MTFIDLCESDSFVSNFKPFLNKILDAGYVMKFYFITESLAGNQSKCIISYYHHYFITLFTVVVEQILPGCKYRTKRSFCEILDVNDLADNPADFAICLTEETKAKQGQDLNWRKLSNRFIVLTSNF